MEDPTRLSPRVHAVSDQIDAARVAPTPVASSESTRLARDARSVDLETEGTRIRGIPAERQDKAAEQEIGERHKIGDKIGDRYEVLAIHRGTMGVVYGTYDHVEMLPRALKTLQRRYANNQAMSNLFAAEATTWVKLEKHPFIVRAYLVEKFYLQPYVVTEYIRGHENMGGDLRSWLGHPKMTLSIAAEMALQVAQGMQHAVNKVPGLVHRDIKPANILVDERARAMVTDFGLVNAEQKDAGTPAYMAPEQWRSERLDVRTDIYAFGCVLYEMFTGHRMYLAHSEADWKSAHLSKTSIDPIAVSPDLPMMISDFIKHCVAKEMGKRPANWDAIVAECARWFHEITGQPVVLDFSAIELSIEESINASYSFLRLEKFPEMLRVCDRALALYPNNIVFLDAKCKALEGLARYEEMLVAANKSLEVDQNSAAAWVHKGTALQGLKRHSEALAACDQALFKDPNFMSAWYEKSNVLISLKRQREATTASDHYEGLWRLEAAEIELARDSSNPDSWKRKGDALTMLERPSEAISAYNRALTDYGRKVAIDPNDVVIWNHIGSILNLLKQHEDALVAYSKALDLYPNAKRSEEFVAASAGQNLAPTCYASTWFDKGVIFDTLHFTDDAVCAYDNAVSANAYHAEAWIRRGIALNSLGRYEEGVASFDRALALDPDGGGNVPLPCFTHFADAWIQRGNALAGLGRYENAINSYNGAVNYLAEQKAIMGSFEPAYLDEHFVVDADSYLSACINTGIALNSLNRREEAISAFERGLAIDPSSSAAWRHKGDMLESLNRHEEAIAAYDEALSIEPDNAIVWVSKAFTLSNLKYHTEAIAACDRALVLDPSLALSIDELRQHIQEEMLAGLASMNPDEPTLPGASDVQKFEGKRTEDPKRETAGRAPRSLWERILGK